MSDSNLESNLNQEKTEMMETEVNQTINVPSPKTSNENENKIEKEDGEIDDEDDVDEKRKERNEEMEQDDEKEPVYCICRTSDTNRFMIGCDKCNEWYHGDCISITEDYAKSIKQFYCLICRDKDPSLQIKFKEKKIKKKEVKEIEKPKPKQNEPIKKEPSKADPDYAPLKSKKYYESDEDDFDDEDFYEPATKSRKHNKDKSTPSKHKRGRPVKGGDKNKKPRRTTKIKHRKKDGINVKQHKKNKEEIIEVKEGPKQCYGPGCINVAKKGSKYCSDECGIKLATNRIVEILPHRIRQWQSTPCEADEKSHRILEEIRTERQEARRILAELDDKQQKLEEMITLGKSLPPLPEDELNEVENEAESELNIYCVSCGHEINHRQALKHMERCFNKYESQTSFGSIYKTKIEGQTVFCDAYNPHQRTYCKRLRILCPEHSKDPKITDDEVCGCPLVANVFEETGNYCRMLKKKCNRHYFWEKLRRAELDTERIQQWLKLDDLFEKEQKIRYTLSNRHGILGLMLHQTIVHDENEFSNKQSKE